VLRRARAHGAGTIAKRSLAGRPWSAAGAPDDPVHGEYYRRFQALRRHSGIEPEDWDALALRFAAYEDGVDCVIVGGSNVQHMQRNLAAVAAGPLEPGLRAALRDAFMTAGADWRGLV
jgi:aryl-alcohol dehydrogenase-like predicted oxidoreductase